MTRGIDLAREERLKVGEDLLEQFRNIFKCKTVIRYKDKQSHLQADFTKLYEELYHFLALSDSYGGPGDMEMA